MATESIALFGITGSTGRHFVQLAIKGGYKVKALVRDPDKVEFKDDNLELIKGSFTEEDVMKTVSGTDYVVSMAGGKLGDPKNYPTDLMLNFAKLLVPIMEKEGTKVFLYQAGAFSPDLNGKMPTMMKVLRGSVGRMMGILPNIKDNDNVIKFLASSQMKSKIIISHPGALAEKPSEKECHLAKKPPMGPVAFKDLAACSLKAIKDENACGFSHYVAY